MKYLDFNTADCKDCFKCLRDCPVKAIKYENHRANIIESKCILCGKCTLVCPQNAKRVHSERAEVLDLLSNKDVPVIASVAPSFISSFGVTNFDDFAEALIKIGFSQVEETIIGAKLVTKEYARLLREKKYTNLITSACPAINRMIQIYYPEALKYLAPVVSPMVAHAKTIKARFPNSRIVFIGPCIAKKREARESGVIDAVLTFEELAEIFKEQNITFENKETTTVTAEKAKNYPITRGIIKSFEKYPEGYEYVTVDGVSRSFDIFKDIEELSGQFIEASCCEYSCINGPCAIKCDGGVLKANENVRKYAKQGTSAIPSIDIGDIDISCEYKQIRLDEGEVTDDKVNAVLEKMGKKSKADELNCGSCGYSTCREKAEAVVKGYAELDMCLPYMRTRAESMSYEIIHNSPFGIVVLDNEYKIIDINNQAMYILNIANKNVKNMPAQDFFDITDYVIAETEGEKLVKKVIADNDNEKYIETTIVLPEDKRIMFGIYKDISEDVVKNRKLYELKTETFKTTDEVIKKQMRVAQEIASLLGETTAETKLALLNLKKTLDDK